MFPLRDSVRTRRIPFVNYAFIAVNIYIFYREFLLAQAGHLEPFILQYGLVPKVFFADPLGHLPNIFSSMFLHGGWLHVLGNMWYLHIFGDNVEENLGHVRYFFYYLLMGIGAAAAQLYVNQTSALPMVGASGAIAGILGSYFVLHPKGRVLTVFWFFIFVKFFELPAFFYLGIWFLMQAMNGVGSLSQTALQGDTGGVAWWAHAGGFAAGFILIFFFRRRLKGQFL